MWRTALVVAIALPLSVAWAKPPDVDAVDGCNATVELDFQIGVGDTPNPVDYVDATDYFLASKTKGAKKVGKALDAADSTREEIRAIRKAYKFCQKIKAGVGVNPE